MDKLVLALVLVSVLTFIAGIAWGRRMKQLEMKDEAERKTAELDIRASGRTTRRVDKYIQDLFNSGGEWITVYDHYPTKQAAKMVVDMIRRRLEIEHHREVEVRSYKDGFELRLKGYDSKRI